MQDIRVSFPFECPHCNQDVTYEEYDAQKMARNIERYLEDVSEWDGFEEVRLTNQKNHGSPVVVVHVDTDGFPGPFSQHLQPLLTNGYEVFSLDFHEGKFWVRREDG